MFEKHLWKYILFIQFGVYPLEKMVLYFEILTLSPTLTLTFYLVLLIDL